MHATHKHAARGTQLLLAEPLLFEACLTSVEVSVPSSEPHPQVASNMLLLPPKRPLVQVKRGIINSSGMALCDSWFCSEMRSLHACLELSSPSRAEASDFLLDGTPEGDLSDSLPACLRLHGVQDFRGLQGFQALLRASGLLLVQRQSQGSET